MSGRAVVATDGSEFAIAAARRAVELLDPACEVVVLSVAQHPIALAPVTGVAALPVEALDEETIERTRDVARDAAAATAAALDVGAQLAVVDGDPGDAICRYAAEHDADVIVVGSHGSGFVKRVLVGSVSHYVLHHAPCPVLVVRAGDHEDHQEER